MKTVFALGGDIEVRRLGFGAMRITGPGTWGPPRDRAAATALLRRAVELGVQLSDTADTYRLNLANGDWPRRADTRRVGRSQSAGGTSMPANYDSAIDLAAALRRAADAHGRHEDEIGHPDPDWPDWYAQYMVDEQSGLSGQASPGAIA